MLSFTDKKKDLEIEMHFWTFQPSMLYQVHQGISAEIFLSDGSFKFLAGGVIVFSDC